MGAEVSGDVKGVLSRVGWALALLGGVLMVWAWLAGAPFASPREGSTPSPTPGTAVAQVTASPTPEPIVPTVTPTAEKLFPTARPTRTPSSTPTATSSPTATPSATVRATRTRVESTTTAPATPGDLAPTATSTPTASETPVTPTSTATSTPAPTFPPTATPKPTNPPVTQGSWRVGVSVATGSPLDYDLAALGVGWVMNWHAYGAPPVPPGVQFAQTLRMMGGRLAHDAATVSAIAAANPGALWLISNEPDVRWQDNVTPEVYAHLYREAYIAIKAGDPNATIAAGGIAQPTPLRLRYLDRVLASYQAQFGEPLPAQAWHIHNYMLREERDSWGVDIPPGFTENQGMLYSVDDSGNVERFKQQLYDFRGWMSSHGYGGLPLIVSEFGIPMPEDYGFPPERVADFLRSTTQFMNTAGGGGLVQRWCWFSLADPRYSTGNLVDLDTREWTSLGRVWMEMVGQ